MPEKASVVSYGNDGVSGLLGHEDPTESVSLSFSNLYPCALGKHDDVATSVETAGALGDDLPHCGSSCLAIYGDWAEHGEAPTEKGNEQ